MSQSSQTLYRKYRPQSFDQVQGQDHIVQVLQKAVENKNFSHAYLFAGSRGTGKTSVARLLAQALGASSNDIYEIDAASNRGVDDIREIRGSVSGLPLESPYKVYIIDEVHMLTKEAFNALLKTLEEPPRHAIFILATTELQKLPDTVASRCQIFEFKTPNKNTLKKVLQSVAKQEKAQLDEPALELIAILADGSFRDGLGTLQKVLTAHPQGKISVSEVEAVTSAPPAKLVLDFVQALSDSRVDSGLTVLQQTAEQNINTEIFLRLVLQKVRFTLFLRHAPELHQTVKDSVSGEEYQVLETLSQKDTLSPKLLYRLLDIIPLVRISAVPTLPLEALIVELSQEK